jgi:hypothetical protein
MMNEIVLFWHIAYVLLKLICTRISIILRVTHLVLSAHPTCHKLRRNIRMRERRYRHPHKRRVARRKRKTPRALEVHPHGGGARDAGDAESRGKYK